MKFLKDFKRKLDQASVLSKSLLAFGGALVAVGTIGLLLLAPPLIPLSLLVMGSGVAISGKAVDEINESVVVNNIQGQKGTEAEKLQQTQELKQGKAQEPEEKHLTGAVAEVAVSGRERSVSVNSR